MNKLSNKSKSKAFTLVELIVVITILAVLGTIAFIAMQNYTVYARDSVRLSNLRAIESGLQIQYTQGGNYAVPDNYVSITASGTLIRKQGVAGKNVIRTIRASKNATKDPLTEDFYDYITDANQSEYQLIAYMEDDTAYNSSILQESFASGTGLTMKSLGQDMGMVSTGGIDLHRTLANVGNSFDIRNNAGAEYTITFDADDIVTSNSGTLLFSNVYNRSKALLRNKPLAKLDDSLMGYWDMETLTIDGKLKDFSTHGNDGILNGEIKIGSSVGKEGKATYFDGVNDSISLGPNVLLGNSDFTLISMIKPENINYRHTIIGGGCGPGVTLTILDLGITKQLRFGKNCGGPDNFFYAAPSYSLSEQGIYRVALSFDGNYNELYVDGNSMIKKENKNFVTYTHNNFYIGSYNGIAELFQGIIDEVRIYNRVLSEKEIKVVYGSTLK